MNKIIERMISDLQLIAKRCIEKKTANACHIVEEISWRLKELDSYFSKKETRMKNIGLEEQQKQSEGGL